MAVIAELFANDIRRRIEEVIKVDQADEEIIRAEIDEYVVTDPIRDHYREILDRYWETPKKPHEGIAVWVSGFFGSGKSSFAKMLGLALADRDVCGEGAAQRFAQRAGDPRIEVLLRQIGEQVPTEAVIFDVSTDRGIRSGNQSITEIMYRLFLEHLGYARDLDLAELEISLEEVGRLEEFKATYGRLFEKHWNNEKGKVAFALGQASRVMHELDPTTWPSADSWVKAARNRADVSPGTLAKRCVELMDRRAPGKNLVFVIDEVGQFVARDVQKMLDLQGVVQNLGRVGRGRMWIVVTSQEKLTELVGGLDDRRVELARLMDRFPLQVHLEPSDISEVTSKRVLSKNAAAEARLRELFQAHRARLMANTRLTADIRLPDLDTDSFVALYPLLPYQVDLVIQVVSGLRTQGGASKHVGGANRTIIKLAQQLLIHPDVDLATRPVGQLVRIDQIYDLVAGNISSEIRGKIDAIPAKVGHPLAQSVAKAICLLQYVQSIHRTAENIAAALHPAVDADSRLVEVKAALDALEKALMVRRGEDGYRIPTPAEDDWERQRSGLTPKPADSARIHAEVVAGLWQPQPSHNLLDTKVFKAGLVFNGRVVTDGDIPCHVTLAEAGKEFDEAVEEARKRSQSERKSVFWVAAVDHAVTLATDEVFRSNEILSRKERGAQTKDETALVADEKRRQRRNQDELKRLLKQAVLAGRVFFRGNERSPGDGASDVRKEAERVLGQALPEVFDRFAEAAARVRKQDLDALLTTENLRGLTPVFSDLALVREQNGQPVFTTESGPLAEVLARIQDRASYGEVATGRWLSDKFADEPFGWDFDVVRLFVVSLLRAGKIEATSKGQLLDDALSLDARNTFPNNNLFKQASFRPREGIDFAKKVEAYEHFKEVFGAEVKEIEQIGRDIKREVSLHEERIQDMHTLLARHELPGGDVLQEALEQVRAIRAGNDDNAVLTFNTAYRELKEAIKRAAELEGALTSPRLQDLARARRALRAHWPFLQREPDLPEGLEADAESLADLLAKETFFRELPDIDVGARKIDKEYDRRFDEAVAARTSAYQAALETLQGTPGWEQLDTDQQERVAKPLATYVGKETPRSTPIPQIRAETEACAGRLQKAIEEMLRIVDGARIVKVRVGSYFAGGIETTDQLDAALQGLREECERQIGAGKKVLVQ